jgi:hypothetical protein
MKRLIVPRKKIFPGPISKVRKKDPSIQKAALFVEDLYGRSLKNDPNVRRLPFFPYVTQNGKKINLPFPKYLGMRHPLPIRLSDPLGLRKPYPSTTNAVHELIHSEDIANESNGGKGLFGFIKGKLKRFDMMRRMVMEGRAVFGGLLYENKVKRFEAYFKVMAVGVTILVASAFVNIPPAIGTVAFIATVIGAIYWPFHNALCTLAKKVGDPKKAFQITTEKPPNLLGIIHPTRYYKEEIAEAKWGSKIQ